MKIKAHTRLGGGGVCLLRGLALAERMSDLCCSAPSRYPSTRHMPALHHARLSLGLSEELVASVAAARPPRPPHPETGELPVKCQALTGESVSRAALSGHKKHTQAHAEGTRLQDGQIKAVKTSDGGLGGGVCPYLI